MTFSRSKHDAFTLIEIMIVVGLIGIVMAFGIPSMVQSMKKEGMRKAVADFMEACATARNTAILSGQTTQLVIRPEDGTFNVSGFSGTLPSNVHVELMKLNIFVTEDEEARVRFFPNSTSDEFAIVFRSDEQEVRMITLDVVTALPNLEVLVR